MRPGQKWNGLRRLLSRSGGRLSALKRTVSKPDAKAVREHLLYSYLLGICQEFCSQKREQFLMSIPQTAQYGRANCGQLFSRNMTRDEFSLTIGAHPPGLETVEPAARNRHNHVAFRPHLFGGKWMRESLNKLDHHVVWHWWVRCGCAQRDNSNQIASTRQSRNNHDNWSAFHHLRHNKTMKITQQNFAQFGIIRQRHMRPLNGNLRVTKGYCL